MSLVYTKSSMKFLVRKSCSRKRRNNVNRMLLVNAADNKQRDKTMTSIEVDINQYVIKRELLNWFGTLFSL